MSTRGVYLQLTPMSTRGVYLQLTPMTTRDGITHTFSWRGDHEGWHNACFQLAR